MLKLDKYITLDAAAIKSPNLCDRFSAEDLTRIGIECKAGYTRDVTSRASWMRRNEAGMDLALQLTKDKNFPWPGCSNVAFPLVAIAAQQFHARAYPALINGPQLVKCEVTGQDSTGEKTARAERISTHMSWQVGKQDKGWEEQHDRGIFNLAIVGTNFFKTYHDGALGYDVSELVLAKNLVMDYWAKSVEACPRKTQIIPMFRNEIYERVLRGTFRDVLEDQWYLSAPTTATTQAQTNQDNRQGVTPPAPDDTTPFTMLEQHVSLDLDGDGYAEPYIVTFEHSFAQVVRIVTRFERESAIERAKGGPRRGQIICVKATEYFTKYSFVPSPDGGIYDVGFGVFLGPLNESVNSLINQLIDCGTMQTTAGGFLGRGAKMRGGVYTFAPLEWKRVDSAGDDLRKSIYPLPVRDPSMVLFQLLGLLIDYTNRLSGSTDMLVGENPGQNTPAQTAQTMVEQGQKLFVALFKRCWRAMKEEFEKRYVLNSMFAPEVGGLATIEDYLGNPDEIAPAADPNLVSDVMQIAQADAVKASASVTVGYDKDEVERRWLKARKVADIDRIFPGSKGQEPPKDPKITVAEMKLQGQQMELEAHQQEFVITLMEERRVNNAKILELEAKAEEAAANAQSEQAYAQVAAINAGITQAKTRNEALNRQIELLLKKRELDIAEKEATKPEAKAA